MALRNEQYSVTIFDVGWKSVRGWRYFFVLIFETFSEHQKTHDKWNITLARILAIQIAELIGQFPTLFQVRRD